MHVITKQSMKIAKLSDHIGAEATGIDLTKPVDADTRKRLNEAVVENIALVIRDQHFTPEQFLAAASLFGEPMEQHFTQYAVPDHPLVHKVSNRHTDKSGTVVKNGADWHTDHTNHVRPPKNTCLYAVSLPDSGGGTSVVNMRAAYNALPETAKQTLNGMKTVNVFKGSASGGSGTSAEAQVELKPAPILQPLVRTNPDNGTKAVYFHPNKTENIVGMDPEASQVLLDDLVGRLLQPEFIYSHKWRKGDMFLWDNRSSLHKASFDYDPAQHRKHYRVHIKGERAQ